MTLGNYNYQKNLRKSTIAFGSVFNSIVVRRTREDGSVEDYRVPCIYAPKEKFIQKILQPSAISTDTKVQKILPFMSYVLTSTRIDRDRARNRNSTRIATDDQTSESQELKIEIPITLTFNLFLYTRKIDDTLAILEHLITNFPPSDNVMVNYVSGAYEDVVVPISLLPGIIMNERYDGDFEKRRINISSLSFEMKTYLFASSTETTVIDTINTDIQIDEDSLDI